ncbi:hypothetical protein K469DRAFT_310006 [Zopfia rhizophila CBS 207.26]|uniref:Uncharacterized protein n=1 Tax=Zopfia rhizophila CBS 207.26 TaxID=1314779 RepID=A0A6A6EMQ4_9PEZI|nr:hypothetical protein K469DRAFT_310006 [Zopfia rhizophila CBS 207.26]
MYNDDVNNDASKFMVDSEDRCKETFDCEKREDREASVIKHKAGGISTQKFRRIQRARPRRHCNSHSSDPTRISHQPTVCFPNSCPSSK